MDLAVVEDGTTIHPSTDQSSVKAAVLVRDLACPSAQNRTSVSAAEFSLSDNGKSVSSANIDIIEGSLSDHSLTTSQLKGEIGIFLEPLPAASSLPNSSDFVWHGSLDQGDGDSDLRIQIQSSCSIDMNVFEQMSSLSGKQTVTGTSSCYELVGDSRETTIEGELTVTSYSNFADSSCVTVTRSKQAVTGTSNCDESIAETMMEGKQTVISASSIVESICATMTKGEQAATGINSCDVSIAETTTEVCKAVDTTRVIVREVKAQESTCAINSIPTSTTRDLNESDVDCRPIRNTFPECDSTQALEVSACQSQSNEAGDTRNIDEIPNHVLDLKDECNLSGRSMPVKKINISEYSDTETRNAEISEVQAPLARFIAGSQCISSGVQSLASAVGSHIADTTEGDDQVKDVTCAGARNVSENTEAETSCEKTDLSSEHDCLTGGDSTRSDADLICGKAEPKLNDCEEKERSGSGENSQTKINDQELSRDEERCIDDESKMDLDETATDPRISVDSSAIESDSSTKDQLSNWSPSSIPTLQARGNNQPHMEKRKPFISSKFQPATKQGHTDRWGNERQRGWQGAPSQDPVSKRPMLGDIVSEAESGRNRVPIRMERNEGGNGCYRHQVVNDGDQQRPWNSGPEHRPPFSNPHWNNPPPPGYMSSFDSGVPHPAPPMSLPLPGMPPTSMPPPGMPPPGMPPPGVAPPGMLLPGMPPPGMPHPGIPPPGMPVPPPGMLIPPSSSMPGPPLVGGMFMPPPPLVGMEPPGGMSWNAGMPPPPNAMPQPFNVPPPSFMPPPNMMPPGCMAPPGSVAPPFGMPPAGMLPPQGNTTQFPPPGMLAAPQYIGQYHNYGATPLPGNYSGMPVQPDQSYPEWNDYWQRYSQWMQQCNSTTAAPTWTSEAPIATAAMLPTFDAVPSSTSQLERSPQTDKSKRSSSKMAASSKEKSTQGEKESVASISLPPAKPKLNWIETKPPKPSSHNRLPNLTSLVAHFNPKSKRRESPTKEAEPKDPDSSENMLWIGNLPVGTRAIELRSTVSEYGRVSNCKVGALKSQKDAGLFALVTMETAEDAEFCIQKLNNSIYNGQSIVVKKFQKD